jgi:hypothetical protein
MTRKQLLTRALICFVIALITLLIMVRYGFCHAPGEPWPENSCGEQVLAILDQRPGAVVWYGCIQEPGQPGHGQWHVQPQDGDKWLTIDQWNRVHESSVPQYKLLPKLKFTAQKYRERRGKP